MSGKKVFTHAGERRNCISINDLEGYPSKSKLQSKKYLIFLIKFYTLNNFIV